MVNFFKKGVIVFFSRKKNSVWQKNVDLFFRFQELLPRQKPYGYGLHRFNSGTPWSPPKQEKKDFLRSRKQFKMMQIFRIFGSALKSSVLGGSNFCWDFMFKNVQFALKCLTFIFVGNRQIFKKDIFAGYSLVPFLSRSQNCRGV